MSYTFSTTHKSPDDAKAEFIVAATEQSIPEKVSDHVVAIIDTYKDNGVTLLDVGVSGHFPGEGEKSPGYAGAVHVIVTVLQ